jgi:hypothetical protein
VSLPIERMNVVADANPRLARVTYSGCNSILQAVTSRLIAWRFHLAFVIGVSFKVVCLVLSRGVSPRSRVNLENWTDPLLLTTNEKAANSTGQSVIVGRL